MMQILTWNTQWCLGLDGRMDPERIVAHALSMADIDVLCLQETKCPDANFPFGAFRKQVLDVWA